MFRLFVLLCCLFCINAQLEEQHPAPEPYSFAFSSPNEDGTSSSREETGDASGRVTGSYTILGADGQQRRVEYVADENGFRANVITNEIGTESQNSADVVYQSSAPTAAELSAQWEASGAGKARLQPFAPSGPIGVAPIAPIRPAVVAPFNAIRGGAGLVASPIAPLAGGFSGGQALRLNHGIRAAGPLPGPVSRIARLPAPVIAAAPIAPIAAPVPVGPIGGQLGGPVALGGGGVLRAQTLGPINAGFAGVSPFGLRLAPVGGLNLGHFGAGLTPLGAQGSYGGLSFANYPLNGNAGQFGANFLLLPNNLAHNQPSLQEPVASSNVIAQKSESKEDYGRKSK